MPGVPECRVTRGNRRLKSGPGTEGARPGVRVWSKIVRLNVETTDLGLRVLSEAAVHPPPLGPYVHGVAYPIAFDVNGALSAVSFAACENDSLREQVLPRAVPFPIAGAAADYWGRPHGPGRQAGR